jgi:hypothetical protein
MLDDKAPVGACSCVYMARAPHEGMILERFFFAGMICYDTYVKALLFVVAYGVFRFGVNVWWRGEGSVFFNA